MQENETQAREMTGLAVGLLLFGAAGLLWAWAPSVPLPGNNGRPRPAAAGDSSEERGGTGLQDAALMLDLCAAMLSAGRPLNTVLLVLSDAAGSPLDAVLRRVVTAVELGASWEQAWDLSDPRGVQPSRAAARKAAVLRDALTFAASSGAPSAQVLHAQAAQVRRRRAREAERRAAALGIHLVLPLGLCALPAFLCFTVVPLLLALIPEF